MNDTPLEFTCDVCFQRIENHADGIVVFFYPGPILGNRWTLHREHVHLHPYGESRSGTYYRDLDAFADQIFHGRLIRYDDPNWSAA